MHDKETSGQIGDSGPVRSWAAPLPKVERPFGGRGLEWEMGGGWAVGESDMEQ